MPLAGKREGEAARLFGLKRHTEWKIVRFLTLPAGTLKASRTANVEAQRFPPCSERERKYNVHGQGERRIRAESDDRY